MNYTPDITDLLDEINGNFEERKANCEIGLFAVECLSNPENEAQAEREINSFFVKKPAVKIQSYADDNRLYYNVQFIFHSFEDSDYKQMKNFLCRYSQKALYEAQALQEGKHLDKITSLRMSILPEKYHGKYFLFLEAPYWEMISSTEYAFDKSCLISLVFDEQDVIGYVSDDDMIDRNSIEQEIEREIANEYA